MNITTHRLLHRFGLLNPLRSAKRRFKPVEYAFMPCTPHLLIAINSSLRRYQESSLEAACEYLEFGVFRGFSLWYAQAVARSMGIANMRFVGFDSFMGLPSLSGVDQGGEFSEGAYYCPKADVESFLSKYGVDWTSAALVDGWFQDTLVPDTRNKLQLKRCSICVIDCDLYSSTALVLQFVQPLLYDGSIVVFDDWENYDNDVNRGEQKAFNEFLSLNPGIRAEPFMSFGGHGRAFILRFQN